MCDRLVTQTARLWKIYVTELSHLTQAHRLFLVQLMGVQMENKSSNVVFPSLTPSQSKNFYGIPNKIVIREHKN
jgi:hypothetical protein